MIEGRFTIDEHITGVVYRTKSEINENNIVNVFWKIACEFV